MDVKHQGDNERKKGAGSEMEGDEEQTSLIETLNIFPYDVDNVSKAETKEGNDSGEKSKSVAEDGGEACSQPELLLTSYSQYLYFLQLSKAAISCYTCENTSVMEKAMHSSIGSITCNNIMSLSYIGKFCDYGFDDIIINKESDFGGELRWARLY